MSSDLEYALRRALVGEKHVLLYQKSASFKYKVDALARMLPEMVDGLANQAIITDEENLKKIKTLNSAGVFDVPTRACPSCNRQTRETCYHEPLKSHPSVVGESWLNITCPKCCGYDHEYAR